jgi:hypothetical protein
MSGWWGRRRLQAHIEAFTKESSNRKALTQKIAKENGRKRAKKLSR